MLIFIEPTPVRYRTGYLYRSQIDNDPLRIRRIHILGGLFTRELLKLAAQVLADQVESNVEIPAKELKMLEQMLNEGLQERKLQAGDANTILQVTVTKYHFRSNTTPVLTGTLTGNDAIVSGIVVKRSVAGELLGKEEVITHNPTVVSKSEDLIKGHADKIISSLVK